MARANTTYWLGRGIAAGVKHTRFQHLLTGPIYQRAERFIQRWGIFAIPLSFMTVGIQTAVNASAGVARMPLARYLPSVIVGCLIWAAIYSTVGMAVIYAMDRHWLAVDCGRCDRCGGCNHRLDSVTAAKTARLPPTVRFLHNDS